MKRDRILLLSKALSDNASLAGRSIARHLYYFFQQEWWTEQQTQILDPEMRGHLTKALTEDSPWKPPRSPDVFFPLGDIQCVARITFDRPLRSGSLQKYETEVAKCAVQSQHEFEATYNSLTKLYNRTKLEELFSTEIESLLRTGDADPTESVAKTAASLALLNFDIDHFKQVNDSYNHSYGDVVLCAVARRLEEVTRDIESSSSGIRCYSFHPSGEEFQVLLVGSLPDESAFVLAEQFRERVANRPLPTDPELLDIRASGVGNAAMLPQPPDRKVTVSIGISIAKHLSAVTDYGELLTRLKREADAALYRAKATGRNRSVSFDKILDSYGRVIGCHEETQIVTIDIGSNVGVTRGQEFLVYHPDFNGEKEFTISDGRTTKVVGRYPRIPSGQIEIIDVQEEIAFGRVLDKHLSGGFIKGCSIQAVPVGSIDHLIETRRRARDAIRSLTPVEEVEDFIQGLVEKRPKLLLRQSRLMISTGWQSDAELPAQIKYWLDSTKSSVKNSQALADLR